MQQAIGEEILSGNKRHEIKKKNESPSTMCLVAAPGELLNGKRKIKYFKYADHVTKF